MVDDGYGLNAASNRPSSSSSPVNECCAHVDPSLYRSLANPYSGGDALSESASMKTA